MALETATYLDSLVDSNPAGTDDKSDGDNHLRLIKSVLQNTFPNADQAFRLQHGKLKVKSSGSLALTDEGYMMVLTGSLRAVTLPASAPVGFQIGVKRGQSSGAVTKVSAPSGENIGDDGVDLVSSKYELGSKGDYAWFVKNATSGDEWVVTQVHKEGGGESLNRNAASRARALSLGSVATVVDVPITLTKGNPVISLRAAWVAHGGGTTSSRAGIHSVKIIRVSDDVTIATASNIQTGLNQNTHSIHLGENVPITLYGVDNHLSSVSIGTVVTYRFSASGQGSLQGGANMLVEEL